MGEIYEVLGSSDDRAWWLAMRKLGIGASEIAAVLGLSQWSSPMAVYADKIGASEPVESTEPMEWGLELEEPITRVYARRTGRTATRFAKLLRSVAHPWALATLDAWTTIDGVRCPLEIKTADARKADEWTEGPPPGYYVQVQHQLMVTGAARASVACLLGGQRLVWCDVERDEAAIARIIAAGEDFWRCVQERVPPAVDGTEHTRRALMALYPHDDGSAVALAGELLDADEEIEHCKAAIAKLEERKAFAENRIKTAIGTAQRGVLPDGTEWTWKTSERKGYVVEASKTRTLRRKAAKESRAA